jgi:hypothetical protein
VTVLGEMFLIMFLLMIEILEEYTELIVYSADNSNNASGEIPTDLEPIPEEEPRNIAYWLFPIFLIFCLWLFAMIYNLRNKNDEDDLTS